MANIVTAGGINRKKLYYSFTVTLPIDAQPPFVPAPVLFAPGAAVDIARSLTQGFASTLFPAPGSTPDAYGNLLDDNPSPADVEEAIGGWVDEIMAADAAAAATFPTFFVQFFDAAVAVVAPAFGVKSIDPASVKHPAVQVWALQAAATAAPAVFTGRLLIQRQHSSEV